MSVDVASLVVHELQAVESLNIGTIPWSIATENIFIVGLCFAGFLGDNGLGLFKAHLTFVA